VAVFVADDPDRELRAVALREDDRAGQCRYGVRCGDSCDEGGARKGRRQEQGQMFHAVYFRLEVLPGKIPEKKRRIPRYPPR